MNLFSKKGMLIVILVFVALAGVTAQVGQRSGGLILLYAGSLQGGNENSSNEKFIPDTRFSIQGISGSEYEYGADGYQFDFPLTNGQFVKIILTNDNNIGNGIEKYVTSAWITPDGKQVNGYVVTKQTNDPSVLQVFFVSSWGVTLFVYKETI